MASRWKSVRWTGDAIDRLPALGGVYAIYVNGGLCYVGQSSNLKTRIGTYNFRWSYANTIITPWGDYDRLRVKYSVSKRYGEWAMRELRLIRRLEPQFNVHGRRKAA